MTPERLVVALSGSSGAIYGVRLLELLAHHFPEIERHVVYTRAARMTVDYELGRDPAEIEKLATVLYDEREVGAAIASGTFRTGGMVVVPCSIKTLSSIANCYSETLVGRAADVCLKERRRLALVVRETPLHLGQLELMTAVTRAGAVVVPPVPAFYHRPETIEDIVDHTVTKVLDLFDLPLEGVIQRWEGLPPKA